ncbi:hypothetical protein ACPA2L_30435 [Bacillus bombysepticus]
MYDRAMNFFLKQAGYNDLDSMMQAIEQQDLLQRFTQALEQFAQEKGADAAD